MVYFSNKTLNFYRELESVRKIKLQIFERELEKIGKMSEEEKKEKTEKERVLLKLREIYEKLDIIVYNNMIFLNGGAITTFPQLYELEDLIKECIVEEENYKALLEEEEFILDDETKQGINEIIKLREKLLQNYIIYLINLKGPIIIKNRLIESLEYQRMIKEISEFNLSIKGDRLYIGDVLIEKKKEFFDIFNRVHVFCEKFKEII